MKILSTSFADDSHIPERCSKQGGNISPQLEILDIPEKTTSLALICHDPDAPGANGFTHWVVWNIPPANPIFSEGQIPHGSVEGSTDWGENGWGGPQPPRGTHHYVFSTYALDTTLNLSPQTTKTNLEQTIKDHIIDSAKLTGLYAA